MTDYFDAKARQVFARADGDPELAGELADWARQARANPECDRRCGVIVTQTGHVVAHTTHIPATPSSGGVTYLCGDGPEGGRELGLGMAALRRLHGCAVIHVRYSEVCVGAGRFARPVESP